MAEQRDVQALALERLDEIRRTWATFHDRGAHDYTDAGCRVLAEHAFRDVPALLAALDGLVLLHTRQEAALRDELMPLVAEARRLSNNKDLAASQVFYAVDNVRMWLEAALAEVSPPPVASGETAEEAQFTPEAWEKLTQQHQAFLARRSVASGTEAAE